jgi:hypothetical protein
MPLEVVVLGVGPGLRGPPIAVQDVLPGVDQGAGAGNGGGIDRLGGHGVMVPAGRIGQTDRRPAARRD